MSRRYLTANRLAELDRDLSPRDRMLLATLARLRLVTGRQLERLLYTDVTRRRAQQALASLTQRQLVVRLPRLVGGIRAGSAGHVYALDAAGRRLTFRDLRRSLRPWGVGVPFLAHTLAISELYVRLVEAERAGAMQLRDFVAEPGCWRSFTGPYGRTVLKPDAYVITRLGDFEDHWFIEVDRGTEATTTLARKCDVYRRYWQTGTEQARREIFPKVLWLVPDQRRYDALVEVFGRQPAEAWQLFAVALFDEAVNAIARGAVQ